MFKIRSKVITPKRAHLHLVMDVCVQYENSKRFPIYRLETERNNGLKIEGKKLGQRLKSPKSTCVCAVWKQSGLQYIVWKRNTDAQTQGYTAARPDIVMTISSAPIPWDWG